MGENGARFGYGGPPQPDPVLDPSVSFVMGSVVVASLLALMHQISSGKLSAMYRVSTRASMASDTSFKAGGFAVA